MNGYPPVGTWFLAWPARRGEVHLHRVRGYHVDAVERELLVDADCGVTFTAAVAVLVPDPGDADLECGRCSAGTGPRRRRSRVRSRGVAASSGRRQLGAAAPVLRPPELAPLRRP